MELLKYSSDPGNELNSARRSLWAAKHMLGEANKAPESYNKGFWMGQINRRRSELRNLAHKMRDDFRMCRVCGGDCSSANPPATFCPMEQRR